MRLCRFRLQNQVQLGLYDEKSIVPLVAGAKAFTDATHENLALPESGDLLDFLPPDGKGFAAAIKLAAWVAQSAGKLPATATIATDKVELLVPIPRPNKLFLLAGNYAEHIEKGAGRPPSAAETFPYVFMKPPSTTLTDPGRVR